ncbi:MAG: hypothetical protein PHE61_03270 [Candidatus Omnitrophica bacterium]|nr:hypothetical protein [Candidatus Omnitrophota bacterium]
MDRTTITTFVMRLLLAASLVLGLFWTTSVILEESFRGLVLNPFLYFALWVLIVVLFLLLIVTRWPDFLGIPASVSFLKLILWFVVFTAVWDILLMPVFGLIGHLIVVGSWPDPHHAEAGIFNFLMALWLPPFWAPALGVLSVWAKFKKTN